MSPTSKSTHEQYILAIRDAVLSLADLTAEESERVRNTKLIYGVGSLPGARGDRPVKVRVASDDFRAHCDRCGEAFKRG